MKARNIMATVSDREAQFTDGCAVPMGRLCFIFASQFYRLLLQ